MRHVREAFEDDELVRIDCKGLNTSDYKKIGAKLRVCLNLASYLTKQGKLVLR